jgi:hypothetical protein
MAISRVQIGAAAPFSDAALSVSPGGSAVQLGNTLLCFIAWNFNNNGGTAIPSPGTDNLGNVYSLVATANGSPVKPCFALYAAPVTHVGVSTTVVNAAVATYEGAAVVFEMAGLNNASLLDQQASAFVNQNQGATSLSCGPTSSTTVAKEYLVAVGYGFGGNTSTPTAGTGYTMQAACTQPGTFGGFGVMDQIVSSIGTYSATMNGFINGDQIGILLVTLESAPTFTLSGNCGVAGATVTLGGAGSGSTTADGSGNFSFTGLLAGSYTLTPSKSGSFFFPNTMLRVVVNANITNANFGFVSGSANTYTELAYDSAQRANENPINPTDWTTGTGFDALQIASKQIEGTSSSADCAAFYTNATWVTSGQYVQATLESLGSGGDSAFLLLYCALDQSTGYFLQLNLSGGETAYSLFTPGPSLITGVIPHPFAAGDIWRVEKVGNQLQLFYNNTSLGTATNASYDTNDPGLDLNVSATTDIGIIDFVAGKIAPPTYSISGNAGHAGATVSYSGTSSGSVTADGSGNYTIPGLINGSYVITPTLTGYAFTPTSHSETVSGSNITGVDFTAALAPTGGTDFGFRQDFSF